MRPKVLPALAGCGVIACLAGSAQAATHRISATLDGGSAVTVDNMSSFSDATVRSLVLAADRSTVDGCPYDAPNFKGLFKTGDRIIVSDYYIAWLDLTVTNNTDFGSAFSSNSMSRGELAGYWALNGPNNPTFKYFTAASANNCWNWPRNQLIPGSNSPGLQSSGRKHWWDKYGPPTEHTISIILANGTKGIFSHMYSQGAPNALPPGQASYVVTDGQVKPDGSVYYKFSARIANNVGSVDITDGNDSNGIAATLTSEVEYAFRTNPHDVMNAWRFKPSINISSDNIYVYYWVAYGNGQDMDGTGIYPNGCDTDVIGDQWPSTSYTSTWYATSSVPLVPNFGPFAYQEVPAETPVQMLLGSGKDSVSPPPWCQWNPSAPNYLNHDINTYHSEIRTNVVGNGWWMRVGEGTPPESSGRPYFTYLHQMPYTAPNPAGNGTYNAPFDVKFNRMLAWNETHDGTLGFGVESGPWSGTAQEPYSNFTANKWYYTLHYLTSDY